MTLDNIIIAHNQFWEMEWHGAVEFIIIDTSVAHVLNLGNFKYGCKYFARYIAISNNYIYNHFCELATFYYYSYIYSTVICCLSFKGLYW